MAAKLTPKQQRFVAEYLVDLNATQAAIRAGYSAKTATEQAYRLLANAHVAAAIQKRQGKLQDKLEITQEKVLRELAAVAFANGADFAKVVKGGLMPIVEITPTDELPPEKLPAIASMKTTQYGVEIKLNDKLKALELLGKHLGLFDGDAGREDAPSNNLFEALDSIGEEGFDDVPEIQHEAEADDSVVED